MRLENNQLHAVESSSLFSREVSPSDLGRRIIDLLAIHEGEALDLARLRDGSILLRKAEKKDRTELKERFANMTMEV